MSTQPLQDTPRI